jgi:hypothetical protein
MTKFAIFVEGYTELITVREFLLREFHYLISLECRTLFKPGKLEKAEYDFPNPTAHMHFQIVNVGNDNAVLSRILVRETHMWAAGYERIIGLRDMYSRAYREVSSTIDNSINQQFIDGANATLTRKAQHPEKIMMCFAIMEVEAWFLGMYEIFQRLDSRLSHEYIKQQLGIDLQKIDPEVEFFHPAIQMGNIYQLAEKHYDKHKGDIEAIANVLEKTDYANLLMDDKCQSFNNFYDALNQPKDE